MAHETMDEAEAKRRLDRLRSKTVGAQKVFLSETLSWNGEELMIRQPTVSERSAILAAGKSGPNGVGDSAALIAAALVTCSYLPGTNIQPFTAADIESIKGMPAGGDVDEIFNRIMKLLNTDAKASGNVSGPTRPAS